MKIIEQNKNQFVNDFFTLIVGLWYGNKYNAQNKQHTEHVQRKIHVTFEDFSTALCAYTDEGEPIGFFWYKHDIGLEGVRFSGKDAHIISCELYEKYQRQGIGTLLLDEVCSRVKANGGECLYTDTYTNNDESMIFYIKRGFIPVALLPGLNGINDDGQVFMYKRL
ncbi:MAG: GNAT family N-acetyltransferase [Defluviitaleaceae bacterium]|nr:GNAT family N-acetyltransferase [Defluviitaleaceae bacterium]